MRIIFGLAVLLSLAGCGLMGNNIAPADTGETLAADSKDGALLYGVTVKGVHPGEQGIDGKVVWLTEKDAENPDNVADRRDVPLPANIQPDQRRFVVVRVPPGTWSLRQLRWVENERAGAMLPLSGHALATVVKPGEVTYAGDLTFDATIQPMQLTIADNPAAAREALTAYPGITAPFQDRLAEDIRHSKRAIGKDGEKGHKAP